jgi:uncharacterized integral membrane protein
MWIIRWAFIAIIIAVVLGFSLQNADPVRVTIWGQYCTLYDVPLFLVIYVSFIFGVFVYLLVAIFHQLQLRSEIGRLRRENRKLQQELTDMRNLSLTDDADDITTAIDRPETP